MFKEWSQEVLKFVLFILLNLNIVCSNKRHKINQVPMLKGLSKEQILKFALKHAIINDYLPK